MSESIFKKKTGGEKRRKNQRETEKEQSRRQNYLGHRRPKRKASCWTGNVRDAKCR